MAGRKSLISRLDEPSIPVVFLLRLFLGGLFVYMGVHKIGDPVAFLKQIRLYEMLPETPPYYLVGSAIVLPWLEVVCGVALVLGLWRRGAGAVITIMLAVFTPAIFLRAWAIHTTDGTPFFEIAFDCGCGGGPVVIWKKLLENTGLFLLGILMVASRSNCCCLQRLFDRSPGIGKACHRCGQPLTNTSDTLCRTCSESTEPATAGSVV